MQMPVVQEHVPDTPIADLRTPKSSIYHSVGLWAPPASFLWPNTVPVARPVLPWAFLVQLKAQLCSLWRFLAHSLFCPFQPLRGHHSLALIRSHLTVHQAHAT